MLPVLTSICLILVRDFIRKLIVRDFKISETRKMIIENADRYSVPNAI